MTTARALPRARLVLPERRHAVRLDRESLEPRQPIPGPGTMLGCRRGSAATSRTAASTTWRPRAGRGERLHVVPLERIDVAVEQLALLVVGGSQGLGFLDLERDLRVARALQGAVHRRDRGVEGSATSKPSSAGPSEDQHRTLPRRQALQRGHETRGGSARAPRALRRVVAPCTT